MRTTITIDDGVLAELKLRAAKTGRTLSQTIEDAVRESLLRARFADQGRPQIDLPSWDSDGWQRGVDLDDNSALLDLMEGDGACGHAM